MEAPIYGLLVRGIAFVTRSINFVLQSQTVSEEGQGLSSW